MATYSARDGKANWDTSDVGQVKSWTIDDALEVIPVNYKGLKHQESKGGIASGTASITCDYDYADAGQKKLVDALAAATPIVAPKTLKLYPYDAVKYLSVEALLTGWSFGSPESGLVPITFNFALSGAIDPSGLA